VFGIVEEEIPVAKQSKRGYGKKHPLSFFKHTLDRIWKMAFLLDLVLWAVWGAWKILNFLNLGAFMRSLEPPRDTFILGAAIAILVFILIVLITRNLAFVQARPGHILVAAPLFRMRIGYQRVRAVHPVMLAKVYAKRRLGWANKRFLRPFFNDTVLTVTTRGLPMSRSMISLFMTKYILHPSENGFVFAVKDWMGLSTEIESTMGRWRGERIERPKSGLRGLYDE
jgi:hypothetical protein